MIRGMSRVWCSALFAVMASPIACATVEEASVVPTYTGIRVDAANLFASVGCGTRDGQAYKYFAMVNETNQSGVFDCYADAIFQVNPGSYTIGLRTFDEAHWTAATAAGVGPDRADPLYSSDCTALALDRSIATARCPAAGADAGGR
jgi:hypothetical protein